MKHLGKVLLKKLAALLAVLYMMTALSGCLLGPAALLGSALFGGDESDEESTALSTAGESGFSVTAAPDIPEKDGETETESGTEPEEPSEETESISSSESTAPSTENTAPSAENAEMKVDNKSGELVISRPSRDQETPMGEKGLWTFFVYLCGTDLESAGNGEGGMGTMDLSEMLESSRSSRVRFVVETGGTAYWYRNTATARVNERWLIEDGKKTLLANVGKRCMGAPGTLADFLSFGIENYASEKMGLVFWNHGGGSITGVCFDELYDYDSLTLAEISTALGNISRLMTDRFEIIGFDACLMGTLETANILANYARYMVASEESEPGSGWDYSTLGGFLTAHPEADGAAVGKEICDRFYEACVEMNDADIATLSVVDLAKIDPLLVSFNRFSQEIYEAGSDSALLTELVRGIRSAENFGGNNRIDGYTNMVDLAGMVRSASSHAPSSEEVLRDLKNAVVYQISGADHENAGGLSLYYPLEIGGSSELSTFSAISVSPYYLSFVDRQAHGSVSDGDTENYDDDTWFSDDGFWSWLFEEGGGDYEDYEEEEPGWESEGSYGTGEEPGAGDSYWDYLDGYETTGESSLITFEVAPQLDEEGNYYFVLDDDGWYYTSDVLAYVYQISPDGEDVIELGETIDVEADWEYGFFADQFDGYWISLPDGQNLALYIVDYADDYVIYSSPVYLNGEETNLRLKQYYEDGRVVIEGAWDGITDYGASARETKTVAPGDVILPRYYAWNLDTEEDLEYTGWEYTVTEDTELYYELMETGDYLYAFCIDDIFGDYYMTDFVMYTVEEDGSITYYEE